MSNVNPASIVDAPFYSHEHGEFVSGKAARLAEILRDYNPYLELAFIPRSQRDETDTKPFAIIDNSPWRPKNIVRHLTEAEADDPQAILQWLFEGDLSKHGVSDLVARAQAKEAAEKLLTHKKNAEIAAERQELAEALISGGRDHKHSFRHNGKIFTERGARDVSSTIH